MRVRQVYHSPLLCTDHETTVYGFNGCLIVNQERESEFKIVVTAGLQNMISIYISFIVLNNNATSILLASVLEIEMTPNVSGH